MSFEPELRRVYYNPDGTLTNKGILLYLEMKQAVEDKVDTADLDGLIDQRLQAQGLIP